MKLPGKNGSQQDGMIERRVYHVRCGGDKWQVIREGFHRPHIVRDSKEEAVLLAKRLAKASLPGQVIIHDHLNSVDRRFTYDLDSREAWDGR